MNWHYDAKFRVHHFPGDLPFADRRFFIVDLGVGGPFALWAVKPQNQRVMSGTIDACKKKAEEIYLREEGAT